MTELEVQQFVEQFVEQSVDLVWVRAKDVSKEATRTGIDLSTNDIEQAFKSLLQNGRIESHQGRYRRVVSQEEFAIAVREAIGDGDDGWVRKVLTGPGRLSEDQLTAVNTWLAAVDNAANLAEIAKIALT